jgi:hypothetical protein
MSGLWLGPLKYPKRITKNFSSTLSSRGTTFQKSPKFLSSGAEETAKLLILFKSHAKVMLIFLHIKCGLIIKFKKTLT